MCFSLKFASLSYCTPEKINTPTDWKADKQWNYVGSQNTMATYIIFLLAHTHFHVKATNNMMA